MLHGFSSHRLIGCRLSPAEDPDVCSFDCQPEGYTSGIVRGSKLKYNDPTNLPLRRRGLLQWEPGKPNKVLIIKKIHNQAATDSMQRMGTWLQGLGCIVVAEPSVAEHELPAFLPLEQGDHADIDLCITLGGDGTVLHLASLFDHDTPMPPVVSFSMGSLGFLTPFDIAEYRALLRRVLATSESPLYCTLHTRMQCEVLRPGNKTMVHTCLNEVVVDRGAFPAALMLELFIDGSYVTTVEADGLIIATPSGSTAYSMSVGGSLIAPSVPCSIISPIAPLSLSFRPVVVPESSVISVQLPPYARCKAARVSFDGKHCFMLRKGSRVRIQATRNPMPMVNLSAMDNDWYEGITQKLKWNMGGRAQKLRDRQEAEEIYGVVGRSSIDEIMAEDQAFLPGP